MEPPQVPRPGSPSSGTVWPRLKRLFFPCLLFLLAATALTYAADYVVIRYRIASQRNPYGTVVVQPYYAIHLKNGNTEFEFQPPQSQPCVNSLFPHFGTAPCWYLRRHPEKRTDI